METALGAAMKRAGVGTVESKLRAILKNAKGDRAKAARSVWARLRDDGAFRNEVAVFLMEMTADELQGEATENVPKGHGPIASSLQTEREGEADIMVAKGQTFGANSSQPIAGDGHATFAGNGHSEVAEVREPTVSQAGRILRLARPAGAGALRAAAFSARQSVRGESWLLNYQIPDGPRLLSLRWGEVLPMAKRMVREVGHRGFAAVLLRAIHAEGEKIGKMPEDGTVESTLPPAIIAKLSEELSPDKAVAEARAWIKSQSESVREIVA